MAWQIVFDRRSVAALAELCCGIRRPGDSSLATLSQYEPVGAICCRRRRLISTNFQLLSTEAGSIRLLIMILTAGPGRDVIARAAGRCWLTAALVSSQSRCWETRDAALARAIFRIYAFLCATALMVVRTEGSATVRRTGALRAELCPE